MTDGTREPRRPPASDDAAAPPSHLHRFVRDRATKLEKNADFEAREDPTRALHDLRVASRRLRAFADVFRDPLGEKAYARAKKGLKRVTRAGGALRDLDVQRELLTERLAAAESDIERSALEHLIETLVLERERAARRVKKRLEKADVGALARRVEKSLEDAITDLAPDAERRLAYAAFERFLAEAEASVRPSGGASDHGDGPAPDPEALHALRIALKKLRYALELFEPAFEEAYTPLRSRAAALQEQLGRHHDLVLLRAWLADKRATLGARNRHALAAGLALSVDAISAATDEALARITSDPFDAGFFRARIQGALRNDAA